MSECVSSAISLTLNRVSFFLSFAVDFATSRALTIAWAHLFLLVAWWHGAAHLLRCEFCANQVCGSSLRPLCESVPQIATRERTRASSCSFPSRLTLSNAFAEAAFFAQNCFRHVEKSAQYYLLYLLWCPRQSCSPLLLPLPSRWLAALLSQTRTLRFGLFEEGQYLSFCTSQDAGCTDRIASAV